jgi:hypothetical protein
MQQQYCDVVDMTMTNDKTSDEERWTVNSETKPLTPKKRRKASSTQQTSAATATAGRVKKNA